MILSCRDISVLSVDSDIERKARRNVLTDSLAASFPFSSFEIYDEGGIFLGLNKYNRSVAILDIFDSDKYANANGCIYGTTGAGKTFLLQTMALRTLHTETQRHCLQNISFANNGAAFPYAGYAGIYHSSRERA